MVALKVVQWVILTVAAKDNKLAVVKDLAKVAHLARKMGLYWVDQWVE